MNVPTQLLQPLGQTTRAAPAEPARLAAVIARSSTAPVAGLGMPVDHAIAELRARRAVRAS